MSWSNYYQLPQQTNWRGRPDAPATTYFFQHISSQPLEKHMPDRDPSITFAFLGFCCDEGIRRNFGRPGAALGPKALREVLAGLPLHRKNIQLLDVGDIVCHDGKLEETQQALGEAVALLLQNNITPIVLGGGHELSFGHYLGIAEFTNHSPLSIVNFDAHFDMRPLLPNQTGSSGTPFLQIAEAQKKHNREFDYHCIGIQNSGNTIALFETAADHNVSFVLAEEIHQGDGDKITNIVDHAINANKMMYVSLCMDVFAAPYAPGVSAPQVLGITPWQVIPALRRLSSSGKVISYDVAELSPPFDIDSRTTKLAANLIHEIIHHHKRGNAGET